MSAPPEILKHCLVCRRETLHRLAGQISGRTLYACSESCGAPHREVTDPESRTPAARTIGEAQARAEVERWRKEDELDGGRGTAAVYTNVRTVADDTPPARTRKQERTTMANPLQEAISAEVKNQVRGLATKEEVDELETKIDEMPSLKELDRKIEELLEGKLPELVNAALLQLLAKPKAGSAPRGRAKAADAVAAGDPNSCRHKNFMRKCPGCQAKHAEKAD